MASITETNQQYYEGAQGFIGNGSTTEFTTTFDTDLVFGSYDPNITNYSLNNFKLYTSTTGLTGSWTEYTNEYTVSRNKITFTTAPVNNLYIIVQLKKLDGGNYGNQDAYGKTVEENYGSYRYLKISDIVNNFLIAYVGPGKLLPSVKRTDVMFHAKRGLQEFSYDTLKSIKSQELTIPPSLSIIIPQDYVNYVKMCYIDHLGVKRPIYPANNLTGAPYNTPIQDSKGVPTQDNFGENIEGSSITKERWAKANTEILNEDWINNIDDWAYFSNAFGYNGNWNLGQLYGMDPQYSQVNGWFYIDEREGKITFSSNLANKLIILEYLSDGLAYDSDTKVPKLAEEALYAHILHAIIATSINQPEYLVHRLKKERSAKLRNAKIRLSNIKLDEIVQVMRGKSKWIKH